MLARIPSDELPEWAAFFRLEKDEIDAAIAKGKADAAASNKGLQLG